MSTYAYTVYRGTFIHLPRPPASDRFQNLQLVRNRGALWVSSADGRIKGCDWQAGDDSSFQALLNRHGWVDVDASTNGECDEPTVKVKVVTACEDRNEFFFPGFIGMFALPRCQGTCPADRADTHIHAPQFPNIGLFGSSTLLGWLETYTFPVESNFGDPKNRGRDPKDTPLAALRIYDQVVARALSHGTTCASYFATIHVPATNALAKLCHSRGQRAFIGRVCMDKADYCPDYYRDQSAEDSLLATESTIDYIHTLDPRGALIKPIITPRFAPTCSRHALHGLGKLAASYTPPLHIQTHISENTNEVALVRSVFPEASSYAAVYDNAGLLTPRTILAHGVHLTPEDRGLIRERDAKISHCPASNSALGSGIAPVRTMLDEGLTIGLGTDVSGGYSPSILEAVRQACLVSRLVGHTTGHLKENGSADPPADGREKLSVEESLFLATRGGAAVVDMADEIGGFDVGMFWDAQLIELGGVRDQGRSPLDAVLASDDSAGRSLVRPGPVGNVDLFGLETWEEKIQKWVWSGDDRNVRAVWVGGRLVHARE